MAYLLDTNILLRIVHPADPGHALVRTAVREVRAQAEEFYYFSQNLVEFWNVCTRPTIARGGFGLSPSATDRAAKLIERLYGFLPDDPEVHDKWRQLVIAHEVHGVQVHDARLVAAMHVHGISHILTLNPDDFGRYPGVTAVHPSSLLAAM